MVVEYISKGLVLGILTYLGWAFSLAGSLWTYALVIVAFSAALLLGATRARKEAVGTTKPGAAFLFFLLLEYPSWVYAAVVGAAIVAALLNCFFLGSWSTWDLVIALGLGLLLGLSLIGLRMIAHRLVRRGLVLAIGAAVAAWVIITQLAPSNDPNFLRIFGLHLLLAVPVLYLLTLAGRTEETELEIGLASLLLGLALWALLPQGLQLIAIVLPVLLYVGYTQYLLRGMQSFKALLRGLGQTRLGHTAEALTAYRRALQLSPTNQAARHALWKEHRRIDLRQVHQDERLLKLIDFDLCLRRARDLLFADQVLPEAVAEAKQLLDLVADQRPSLIPEVRYYRAVAHAHAGDLAKAEQCLTNLLDPEQTSPDQEASRAKVQLPAWQLALTQHGELRKRVGEVLLRQGRRMDAIAAVESVGRGGPLDPEVQQLKSQLYADLTSVEYDREAGQEPLQQASLFDHKYVYDQGLDLLDDPQRWRRGAELLHIAVRGQPKHAPAVLKLVAEAAAKHGDPVGEREALEEVKTWAKQLGLKNLSDESKGAYYAVVRQLGEAAYREGRADDALDNLLLSTEDPQSGAATLRMIAELYEQKGNVIQTLLYNEQCLMYDGKHPDYVARRDRVYISLQPEDIRQNVDKIGKLIDVPFLVTKAKQLVESKSSGPEQFEWAVHLCGLVAALNPEKVAAWVVIGRAQLRLGRADTGVPALEKAYQLGKANKPGGDDLDAWFLACRILGDHYLQQGRHAEALEAFTDFSHSTKSGADTYYKMGQAAEHLGQLAQAKKNYVSANMYDHPNKYEVDRALERIAERTKVQA
jgi:tetratricopeptide (TPR) repeat protein